jgi:tetratricopeptide (TPR) repeat protein
MTRLGVVLATLVVACLIAPVPVPAQAPPAEAPLRDGRLAQDRGLIVDALKHFRRATAADPNSTAAHRALGEVAEILGELDEALAAYRAAARLSPSDDAIVRLASLAERMGLRAEAIAELQQWLPQASRNNVAELLFRVHVTAGNNEAALGLAKARNWVREGADYCGAPVIGIDKEIRTLLAFVLHPVTARCAVRLAISLTESGHVALPRVVLGGIAQKATEDGQRKQIQTFMKTHLPAHDVPPLAETLNFTALRLATRYRLADEAIALYKRAIAADPKFSWPLRNLGALYAQRGQLDEALDASRRATAVDPNDWRAAVNLGAVAQQARSWEEARIAYTNAAVLDPTSATDFMNAGRMAIYLGNREEGLKALQHALTLDRRLAPAQAFLRTAPDRLQMVDELFTLTGLGQSVTAAIPALRARLESLLNALAGGSADKTAIAESVAQAVTDERVMRLFAASVRHDFDRDRMIQVLAWWRGPVGSRIRQLEIDGIAASREIVTQYAATAEALAAMRRMDAAQQASESQLDVMDGMSRGVLRVLNRFIPPDKRPTGTDIERDRQAARPAVEASTAQRFAYTYRTATSEDIAEYHRFLASDAGRWFILVFRQASLSAVEVSSEAAAGRLVRRSAQQPTPPGTKDTR